MTIYFPELFPLHTRCSLLSSSNFTSISRHDSPVPEVRKCVKCVLNVNVSEEAACCPVTLCGLVTLWLCGVAPTCPLALPINYRWNQVASSAYSKPNTVSLTNTHTHMHPCTYAHTGRISSQISFYKQN